jgi:hypoxanthine-DNA glycosylase
MPTHQKRAGRQDAVTVKHSLAPIVDRDVRVLILGSLPGERSLSAGRYYAAVLEEDLVALDYDLRLARLLIRHVGLWDVVASARRAGSTDAALRDISVNDIAALIATLPELRAIGFNGGASYTHGMRQIGAATARYAVHALPSSSPMHTIGLDAKRSAWLALTLHLR